MIYKEQRYRNILSLCYIVIPLIAFTYKFFIGNSVTKYLYDFTYFYIFIASFIFLLQSKNKKMHTSIAPVFTIIFIMCSILALSLFINLEEGVFGKKFYLIPLLLEYKLLLYLAFISLSFVLIKPVGLNIFVRYSRFFSVLIIFDVFLRFLFEGEVLRPSIVAETNYDGMFVLLGLCALFSIKKNNNFLASYILFAIATLLTQSKTGIACFIVISFIHFFKVGNLKYTFLLLLLSFLSFFIIEERISAFSNDFSKIDRIAMWLSYIELFNESSLMQSLWGYSPGFPLKDSDRYLWWFIENQSEKVGAKGLHAFNFHGFWLRLLVTYGIVFTLSFLAVFISFALKSKPNLYFFILIFLQGFSMGVFYLSVNGLILVLYFVGLTSQKNQTLTELKN